MNFFIEWLKHKFSVHCAHCETRVKCESCETLREQIAVLHKQNQQLLDRLCVLPTAEIEINEKVEHKPLALHVPWRVRRAQLERASLIKKEQLEQNRMSQDLTVKAPKPIDELEEELGIKDATETGTA